MSFTGQLGTPASYPGNLALGFGPVLGTSAGGTPPGMTVGSAAVPAATVTVSSPAPVVMAANPKPQVR